MTGRVSGKLVLVTAAAAGIGRASALMLAREGARVVATDIDAAGLESLKAEAAGTILDIARLDVLKRDEIAALAEQFGAADALVNCAGFVAAGNILTCTDRDLDFSFDLNVKAMTRVIQYFLPAMLQADKGGSIVNIASVCSSVKGLPNRFAYGASKAAVIGLTKSVAADFVAAKIRCNAICPGTVDSPSLRNRIADQARFTGKTEAEVMDAFIARQPLGRIGAPEEIAALVTYLVSDESAFTTGAVHVIDGGLSN
ncbi:MAG: SDR family oxidoreductase [Caulobacteraceae bacterium]